MSLRRVCIVKRLHRFVSIWRWRFLYTAYFIFVRETGGSLMNFRVHVLRLFVNFRIYIFIYCRWCLICNITLFDYKCSSSLLSLDCTSDSLNSLLPSFHVVIHLRRRCCLFKRLVMVENCVNVTVYWPTHHFLSVYWLLLWPVIGCFVCRWTWHVLSDFGDWCYKSFSFKLLLFPCLDWN